MQVCWEQLWAGSLILRNVARKATMQQELGHFVFTERGEGKSGERIKKRERENQNVWII